MATETLNAQEMDDARAKAWEAISGLNNQFSEAETVNLRRPSTEFKQAAQNYTQMGEELAPQLSDNAKEATGIRDGKDLGEFLHEKAAWAEQIERESEKIGAVINSDDQKIIRYGINMRRDPMTGKQVPGENGVMTGEPDADSFQSEYFLNMLGNQVAVDGNRSEIAALTLLATNREVKVGNPDARDAASLNINALSNWLDTTRNSQEKMAEMQKSPSYNLVKRAVAARELAKQDKYEVPRDSGTGVREDIRETALYRQVDELLTGLENEEANKE